MQLEFRNTTIHYHTAGEGKAVVLLHGFLESQKIWQEFIPTFSKLGRIISIDLPGHGKSGCLGEVHSMEDMAEIVHVVLTELNVEKADFIGHSMGGYVLLAFLAAYPEKMNDIMLLNSTPATDSQERREMRDRSVDLVRKNKRSYVRMAISNLLSPENKRRFNKQMDALKKEALQFPAEGITANLLGMKIRTNRTEALEAFSGGKTIVAGRRDPVINYKEIKALANQTGCTLITFPGGHLSFIENRENFLNLCISSKK